jgi:hypothetical protein
MTLSVVYRFVCTRENRKRDETGVLEGFDYPYEDDLTDRTVCVEVFTMLIPSVIEANFYVDFKNPQFRYIY